jgi:hypothetical protein
MALGRGPCSDTYWKNKETQCRIPVPLDKDIMAMDIFKVIIKGFKKITFI